MTTTYQKTSAEILDYTVDWASFLSTDTISTSTWTLDTGITKVSDSHTTTTCTAFISGGSTDRTYMLTNVIVTAGGRTAARSFNLAIIQYEYV